MAPIAMCTTNVSDGETVHQRCLLLTGSCPRSSDITDEDGSISIKTIGPNGSELFPEQTWPTSGGMFKALIMLMPGQNTLDISHAGGLTSKLKINITYIPLLQCPPLHLVIMVAKDSPLTIDCPSVKGSGFSSSHADLDAAIAKFRMTAYMWQAMTAEDLKSKGVGRRSFRLDEEWAADTVSRDFTNSRHSDSLAGDNAMRATAKVHVIRSSRTTKEIRDANIAQQNPSARRKDDLFDYFLDALNEAEGPFKSSAHPVVAGLVLDSHYNAREKLIVGHAALGMHNNAGVSLGMFGSHLTYSWPRFLEEVTSCLTDTRAPGDKVGNDNGECETLWEACTIGQGAFLHEVGHAFGSPHRSGIMERGYAQDWPKNFLTKTAYCAHTKSHGVAVDESTSNRARWNLSDALSFCNLAHFGLPSDPIISNEDRHAQPLIDVSHSGDEHLTSTLQITSASGIVRVSFNGRKDANPTLQEPSYELLFTEQNLEERFDRARPLSLRVLGLNGREATVNNVWKMLAVQSFVRIPGSNVRLYKRSVYSDGRESGQHFFEWAQLLREKGPDGNVHRAVSIDLRVGCWWDGGIVKYEDGHVSHWGPMRYEGRVMTFGGHASEEIQLPPNVNIKRIEVNRGGGIGVPEMEGVRMHLANRTSAGELNGRNNIVKLQPSAQEVIVGFYGKTSDNCGGVMEFGIITAPKDVGLDGLPAAVFDLPELRNEDRIVDGDEEMQDAPEEDEHSSGSDEDGSDSEDE